MQGSKFQISEKSKEMFEFLMANNEAAASTINAYRVEQDKKISQILNYYKSYLKSDVSKDILIDKDENNLTRLNNQVKLVDSIHEVIAMRINMILTEDKQQDNKAGGASQYPVHRFLVLLAHRFQSYPAVVVSKKFKLHFGKEYTTANTANSSAIYS